LFLSHKIYAPLFYFHQTQLKMFMWTFNVKLIYPNSPLSKLGFIGAGAEPQQAHSVGMCLH